MGTAITKFFDWLLLPLAAFSPIWNLLLISALTGVLFLILFGKVSNQGKIRSVKKQIFGSLLETALFNHDIKLSLRAQGSMVAYALRYFSLALPPLVVLAVPCLLIMAQLHLRYGSRALEAGEKTVVTVALNDKKELYEISLKTDPRVLATPPLRIQDPPQIVWRLDVPNQADISGAHQIEIVTGGKSAEFSAPVIVSQSTDKLPTRWYSSPIQSLLYPTGSSTALPASIREVSINYPETSFDILGVKLGWLTIFLVVSLASGLVASKFLGVEV